MTARSEIVDNIFYTSLSTTAADSSDEDNNMPEWLDDFIESVTIGGFIAIIIAIALCFCCLCIGTCCYCKRRNRGVSSIYEYYSGIYQNIFHIYSFQVEYIQKLQTIYIIAKSQSPFIWIMI